MKVILLNCLKKKLNNILYCLIMKILFKLGNLISLLKETNRKI